MIRRRGRRKAYSFFAVAGSVGSCRGGRRVAGSGWNGGAAQCDERCGIKTATTSAIMQTVSRLILVVDGRRIQANVIDIGRRSGDSEYVVDSVTLVIHHQMKRYFVIVGTRRMMLIIGSILGTFPTVKDTGAMNGKTISEFGRW